MPRPVGLQSAQQPGRTGLLLRPQRLVAEEGLLGPADRPAQPGLHRGDGRRQVLTVQRVAHLGAQRVPGAEPGRLQPVRLAGGHDRVPDRQRGGDRDDQLVAALAGVAGPADRDRGAGRARPRRRTCSRARSAARRRQHLVGVGALDGQDGEVAVPVGHPHLRRGRLGQPGHHLARSWRRWGSAARRRRSAGRRSGRRPRRRRRCRSSVYWAWPGPILARSLVRQRLTNSAAPGPVTVGLAEVADVEDADRLPYRRRARPARRRRRTPAASTSRRRRRTWRPRPRADRAAVSVISSSSATGPSCFVAPTRARTYRRARRAGRLPC